MFEEVSLLIEGLVSLVDLCPRRTHNCLNGALNKSAIALLHTVGRLAMLCLKAHAKVQFSRGRISDRAETLTYLIVKKLMFPA